MKEKKFEQRLILNSVGVQAINELSQLIDSELEKYNTTQINKETLKQYLKRFNREIGKSNISSDEELAKVLSAINLFRYEFENRTEAYQGTFVLPKEIRNRLPNNGIYFEIGMGPGENIITLANEKSLDRVIGCDISSSMVYRAQRAYDKGNFFVGDAQDLPLAEESIDVAIICNALDRIPTARSTIEKIGRLVKPSGYLVVAQCDPFQNEYVDSESGFRFVYVPRQQQLNSVDEAIEAAGLTKTYRNDKPFEWNINTLLYGKERLDVNIAIGRK